MCRIDGGCPQQARRAGFRVQAGRMALFETVRYFGPICVQDARTITVFVQNTGQNPLTAYLEVGPDGSAFMKTRSGSKYNPGKWEPSRHSYFPGIFAWPLGARHGEAQIYLCKCRMNERDISHTSDAA